MHFLFCLDCVDCKSHRSLAFSSASSITTSTYSSPKLSFSSPEERLITASSHVNICSMDKRQESNPSLHNFQHEKSSVYLGHFTMAKPTHKKQTKKRLVQMVPTASSLLLNESENSFDHLSSECSSKPHPTTSRIKPIIHTAFENPTNHFLWQRLILSLIVALKVDNVLEIAVEMLNKLSLKYPAMMKWFVIRLLIDAPNANESDATSLLNNNSCSFQSIEKIESIDDPSIYSSLQNIKDNIESKPSTKQLSRQKSATALQQLVSAEANKQQSLMPLYSTDSSKNDLEDEWGQFTDFDEEPTHETSIESAFLVDPFSSLSKYAARRSGWKASPQRLENLEEEEEDDNEESSEMHYVRSVSSFDFPVFF